MENILGARKSRVRRKEAYGGEPLREIGPASIACVYLPWKVFLTWYDLPRLSKVKCRSTMYSLIQNRRFLMFNSGVKLGNGSNIPAWT